MRRVLLVAAVLAGCGVKAPPRPPLKPGEEARPRAAAATAPEPAPCSGCELPTSSPKAP